MTDDKVKKKSNVGSAFGYDPNQKLPEVPNLNQSKSGDVMIKTPDGKFSSIDGGNMIGKDWHRTISASDGTIDERDIKKYYNIAMKLDWQDGWYSSEEMKSEAKTPGYKHIHLGGSDTERVEYEIEQDWVKEIWDQVDPGVKLLRHYLNGHSKGQSGGIHVDGWTNNQYTVIVYLTPDMQPEDGGSLELWTPNLNDEVRAIAVNTPFGFTGSDKKNILKSYWPKAGRVVVFDARIPHVARSVESDKFRVSLVFKGTTDNLKGKEVDSKDFK